MPERKRFFSVDPFPNEYSKTPPQVVSPLAGGLFLGLCLHLWRAVAATYAGPSPFRPHCQLKSLVGQLTTEYWLNAIDQHYLQIPREAKNRELWGRLGLETAIGSGKLGTEDFCTRGRTKRPTRGCTKPTKRSTGPITTQKSFQKREMEAEVKTAEGREQISFANPDLTCKIYCDNNIL